MKLQKLRDELAAKELRISELESEIAQHESSLGDFKSVEETLRLTDLVSSKRAELETSVARWEALSAELEASA
jgi:hypothetical protein